MKSGLVKAVDSSRIVLVCSQTAIKPVSGPVTPLSNSIFPNFSVFSHPTFPPYPSLTVSIELFCLSL